MAESQMQLEDWLDDLCVRFIINLPQEDLSSVARICFQVEEAQWFYEDFIRPLDPTLPSMSLRTFCLRIFQHCPLLASFSVENHTKAFEEFLQYKTRVPVRGAIMLNHAMDSVVLVKGWKKGANWSFPRGKINKDEDDLDCAVREVYEETGLDLREAGLVPTEKKPKYIEISMREQQLRLYVFRDVPMDTNFQPRTRKEISKIEWYKLSQLPAFRKKGAQNEENGAGTAANKFYMVAPFLVPLKKWIASQKKVDERRIGSGVPSYSHHHLTAEEAATTEDDAWAPAKGFIPSHIPAIETLDGATQELQRLLKMQPPTQGLQPSQPSHQDKGSALLSLLQANSSGPKAMPMVPQTPLDLTVTEPPQPRNPHHHTNQHPVPIHAQSQGPPPAFQLPTNQPTSWNPAQAQNANVQQPQQGPAGPPTYYPAGQQVSLAHPQPLPPQVQRAMFDRSAFQEGHSGIPQGIQAQQQPRQPQQPQQTQRPQQPQGIPPAPHAPQGSGPVQQLSGPSMALLNAFKRDTAPAPRPTHVASSDQGQGVMRADKAPQDVHPPSHTLPQGLPNLLESAANRPQEQRKPSELAGSAVGPPTTQHRSALLEMFKKTTIDAAAQEGQKPKSYAASGPSVPTAGAADGKMLLQQLQQRGHGAPGPPLNHVPINPPPAQHEMPSRDGRERGASYQQASTAARSLSGTQPQAQPTRILQRGQTLHDEQPVVSPKTLSYGQPAQSRLGQAASPQTTHPVSRPAEVPADQKRQLLSLFSKQKSPPAGMEPAAAAHQRSRVASMASGSGEPPYGTASASSSRRGTETPISPADQSFLLDYLQNVTNTATR